MKFGNFSKQVVQNLNPLEVVREYFAWKQVAEQQQTERERIMAQRDVAVLAIETEREVILEYFKARFSERKDSLNSFFQILRTAVKEKDDKAMDMALTGILSVLKDSPLKDFETFKISRAKGELLEI